MKSFFACLPLLALSVIATPVTNLVKRESVTVHFIETATTYFGENIFVVGGINELGNWNTDNAIALSPSNYPDWDTYVIFPANTRFEYKFIRKAPNGAVTWEFDPLGANRVFTTGSSGTATVSSSFDNRGTTVSQSNGGGGGGSDGTVEGDFSLLATTYYGENIYLAGSIDALGNWDTSRALLLSAADYPTWKISVDLPASTSFEFKFFRLGSDGSITWEFNSQGAAGNRKATTPSSGTFFFSATFNGEATVSTSTSMSSTTTTTMSSTTTSTTTSTTPTLTSTSYHFFDHYLHDLHHSHLHDHVDNAHLYLHHHHVDHFDNSHCHRHLDRHNPYYYNSLYHHHGHNPHCHRHLHHHLPPTTTSTITTVTVTSTATV